MADQDRLQQQLSDIGLRYLKRTLGEIQVLRGLLQQLRDGNAASLKDIELLSHKIHGSGAMFGFDSLSAHARDIELATADAPHVTPDLLEKLTGYVASLAAAADKDALERNVHL